MNLKVSLIVIVPCILLYYWQTATVSDNAKRQALENKVILVTGASSGIGEEVAYQLAGFNSKLILVARTASKLNRVKENLVSRGFTNVHVIVYDFSKYKESGSVINDALKVHGRIDVAIINHGGMPWGPFLRVPKHQDPDFINHVFNVNFHSYVHLILAALPVLENTSGHIFVTSSLLGEVSNLMSTVYGSTKHALNGFSYSLQQSLLAENSNVTLTVGAIGLIITKELGVILKDRPIPGFAKGDLKECASLIVGSLKTRQRTLSYPRFSTFLARLMFQLNPYFNELIVSTSDYQHEVDAYGENELKMKEMSYQIGF